jgi:hypothetical protein
VTPNHSACKDHKVFNRERMDIAWKAGAQSSCTGVPLPGVRLRSRKRETVRQGSAPGSPRGKADFRQFETRPALKPSR